MRSSFYIESFSPQRDMPENDSLEADSLPKSLEVTYRKRLYAIDITFLILLAISCLGNIVGPLILESVFKGSTYELVGSFMTGLLLSQFCASASWVTSSPLSNHRRSLVVLVVGLILALSVVVGGQAWPGMPLGFALFAIGIGALFGFVNWFFLSLWNRLFHLQVVGSHGIVRSRSGKRQYGIGYLLGWMTAIAIGIVVMKLILPKNSSPWLASTLDFCVLAIWFVWLMLGVSVVALLTRNLVLGGWSYSLVITIVVFLLGPLLFQAVAYWLFSVSFIRFRFPLSYRTIFMAYCIEAGVIAGCWLCSVLMRLHGYRLVDQRKIELG